MILNMRGENSGYKNWSEIRKLENSIKLNNELCEFYQLVSKLAHIYISRGLKLVIENPCGEQHYLTRYWCIRPKIIDKSRRVNGDYYEKPTQYWFIGFEPSTNVVFEPIEWVDKKIISKVRNQVERSMIHPQYASRFIRQHILTPEQFEKAQRELEKTR